MSTDKLMDFKKILHNFDNSLQSENIKANFNNCICIYITEINTIFSK